MIEPQALYAQFEGLFVAKRDVEVNVERGHDQSVMGRIGEVVNGSQIRATSLEISNLPKAVYMYITA